jgi:hypothetical protein
VTDRGESIELTPVQAMAATRHLVLEEISKRLNQVEDRFDLCDAECDRALMEIWRLTRWVEARIQRNASGSSRAGEDSGPLARTPPSCPPD